MKIVITGIGGQGVVFLSRVFATAAHLQGKPAISAETHGMAQRGASIISFVKVGNYNSPLIRCGTAEYAFCLKESELARAVYYLAPQSPLFCDADKLSLDKELDSYINKNEIRLYNIPATSAAHKIGNPRGANLYMLGAASGSNPNLAHFDDTIAAIRSLSPKKFSSINIKLFESGYKEGATFNGKN